VDTLLAGSQVSRFLVLHKELDADDGELTRTNKVRRGFIAEKYAVLIDALYGGKTSSSSKHRSSLKTVAPARSALPCASTTAKPLPLSKAAA
jgi:hypothetical protein